MSTPEPITESECVETIMLAAEKLRRLHNDRTEGIHPNTLEMLLSETKHAQDVAIRLSGENAVLAMRLDTVRSAAQALVDKLDAIEHHPAYKSVFTFAAIHHASYNGPTWTDEREALKRALAENSSELPKVTP